MIEVFAAIVVILILVTLLIPAMSTLRARAQRGQCTANLRSLYLAANLFVQEKGSWPQIHLASDSDTAESDYANAWIAALKPFGATQKTWICPTIQELLRNPDLSIPENVRVDYLPTSFDDKPATPYRWPHQPWFGEVADVHGNGNLIVFTDGSISDLRTVAQGAQPRQKSN